MLKRGLKHVPQRDYVSVIRKYVEILGSMLGDDLISVILFGSVARGEADSRSSDIDLYIVARSWPPFFNERFDVLRGVFKRLMEAPEYEEALARSLHISFSEYPLTVNEAFIHGPLDLEVYGDGIILFERGDFVSHKFSDLEVKLTRLGAKRVDEGGRQHWVLKEKVEFGEVIEL